MTQQHENSTLNGMAMGLGGGAIAGVIIGMLQDKLALWLAMGIG